MVQRVQRLAEQSASAVVSFATDRRATQGSGDLAVWVDWSPPSGGAPVEWFLASCSDLATGRVLGAVLAEAGATSTAMLGLPGGSTVRCEVETLAAGRRSEPARTNELVVPPRPQLSATSVTCESRSSASGRSLIIELGVRQPDVPVGAADSTHLIQVLGSEGQVLGTHRTTRSTVSVPLPERADAGVVTVQLEYHVTSGERTLVVQSDVVGPVPCDLATASRATGS